MAGFGTGGTLDNFSADWLRERFARAGRRVALADEGARDHALTPAAVLVPVVDHGERLTVLLTRRTAHLRDHPGQISFPGGRAEGETETAEFTALRETEEEIGLPRDGIELLGRLPDYRTITGFRVTPVVGLLRPPLILKLDDFEVAEAFEVPLPFLLDPVNHQRHSIGSGPLKRHYWAMPYGDYYIWGATAGMLVSLYHFLLDEG